ncbi:hypothetical protein HY478_03900 [Candidatus Uhrbacteria bacterium]|nr:hypothetical protein [Candidatus Uhrbacteria bacterium]
MREAILRTLAYFDIVDYPLSGFEIWKLLRRDEPCSYGELIRELSSPALAEVVERADGFWFLRGRVATVALRQERYRIAERKYRRVRRALGFLRLIPSIRMVAICNTLAWSHSHDDADIDLFVVTKPGALWWSRLLAVSPFALFALRPQHTRARDLFCFSFFATERALDLASVKILPDDPYLLYWIASLVPLYDPDGLIEALWDANQWMAQILPNAYAVRPSARRRVSSLLRIPAGLDDGHGPLESMARAIQLAHLPRELRTIMNLDERVIVTDELLKFHENDRRKEFHKQYAERCGALGV